jgi:hypothetical protein
MHIKNDFIIRIETARVAAGLSKSAFGRLSIRNPNFLFNLEAGRSPRLDTVERVDRFINRLNRSHGKKLKRKKS